MAGYGWDMSMTCWLDMESSHEVGVGSVFRSVPPRWLKFGRPWREIIVIIVDCAYDDGGQVMGQTRRLVPSSRSALRLFPQARSAVAALQPAGGGGAPRRRSRARSRRRRSTALDPADAKESRLRLPSAAA